MEDESIAFDFASNITRGEVVAILARILPKDLMRMEITLDDLEDVPWWAMESFEIMLAGIMSGYDDNIQPLREITRAEALKLLLIYYKSDLFHEALFNCKPWGNIVRRFGAVFRKKTAHRSPYVLFFMFDC